MFLIPTHSHAALLFCYELHKWRGDSLALRLCQSTKSFDWQLRSLSVESLEVTTANEDRKVKKGYKQRARVGLTISLFMFIDLLSPALRGIYIVHNSLSILIIQFRWVQCPRRIKKYSTHSEPNIWHYMHWISTVNERVRMKIYLYILSPVFADRQWRVGLIVKYWRFFGTIFASLGLSFVGDHVENLFCFGSEQKCVLFPLWAYYIIKESTQSRYQLKSSK